MKGHKEHHHRAAHKKGGAVESPMKGKWESDAAPSDAYAGGSSKVLKEAKERKHGGKAKHSVGKAEGKMASHRGDRKPRKTGGRAGSNMNPLSSAAHGTQPAGRSAYKAERN